jgi:uncharacterized protein (TIGR00299 family) protein
VSPRILYLDCASGAAGDMLLGALVDLGLPLDALRAELAKLPLRGYRLESHRVHRAGLHATKVDVVVGEEPGEGHSHVHVHGHVDDHGDRHAHAHGQRRLPEILALIDRGGLEPAVKAKSAALFQRLAEAEATVHGTRPEDVHFHEVGAVDAIVDIVGGVIGLSWLKADRVVASPLNVGTGTVSMSHGTFAVPPPATASLVRGVPVYGAGEGELLTPTGALLVTGHAQEYGPLPPLRLSAIGHGAGSRDTPGRPNVLRLLVGEAENATPGERVLVIETTVDDMSPQLCGPLLERLQGVGAIDAFFTPVQMKKGRPGLLITVLGEPSRRGALEEVLFTETTTLGLRYQEWDRTVLEREVVPVATAYGEVGVKVGRRGSRILNVQPEFEDCQRQAEAAGVPVKEVWAAALAAYRMRG